MQYLLTKEEIGALVPKDELVLADKAIAAARERLLKLADFDCIHNDSGRKHRGYCKGSPSDSLKEEDYDTWERVCWLSKNYGK